MNPKNPFVKTGNMLKYAILELMPVITLVSAFSVLASAGIIALSYVQGRHQLPPLTSRYMQAFFFAISGCLILMFVALPLIGDDLEEIAQPHHFKAKHPTAWKYLQGVGFFCLFAASYFVVRALLLLVHP